MILVFHFFTHFFYDLYRRCIISRNAASQIFSLSKEDYNCHPLAQMDAENEIKFDPPVYKQRYERAAEILVDDKWRDAVAKVADFGCAEFGLFVFLKNQLKAREIVFVDVDELLLRDYLYRVYPLTADHICERENPLTVTVFAGSISDPDANLINTDAVVALEIIEHLYPDTLEALPYNLFGYIHPKLVIVTTPNADFNVLFKNMKTFRHYDHKFEWTREQFQSWATNITLRFPHYTVQFDGVGLGPAGFESLGCCSQLALFIRKDIICDNYIEEPCICDSLCKLTCICSCFCLNGSPKSSFGVCTYNSCSQKPKDNIDKKNEEDSYKLVVKIDYPHHVDTRTEDEKILSELKYRLNNFNPDVYYNYERNRMEIPISRLVYKSSKFSPTESEMKTLLLKFNYQIEECLNEETNQVETCVIYEAVMDSGGSDSDTEASGYESDKHSPDEPQLSEYNEKDRAAWNNTPDNVKAQLRLEVSNNKKQQGALFDSGYQKSPSVPDESPQPIAAAKQEAIPLEYKSLSGDKPNKLSNILSVFDNFDKINELDAVRKEKKFFNFSTNLPHREVMKKICQEIAKHPIPGPSREPKKPKHPKKSQSSDSDESVEDVKAITNCILENSLNKIECKEEEPRGNLIRELIPEEVAPDIQEVQVLEEPAMLVENGDLANNNRDLEGNNYAENADPEPPNDNAVDNIDHNNVNIDNNNEVVEEVVEELVVEEVVEENIALGPPVEVEVAWSSREALFDANSQVDLLEDFEMDVNSIVFPSSCVLVANSGSVVSESVLPPEETGFPNWLLQIFEEGEVGVPEDDLHDEPHFYCQGDGLGVHPSTVAINDDADDEGNDSDSDSGSSSSSSSADFANAENHSVGDLQSVDSSRDDSVVVVGQSVALGQSVVVGQSVAVGQPLIVGPVSVNQSDTVESTEQEEVFENAEGSESNLQLVSSSCTQ